MGLLILGLLGWLIVRLGGGEFVLTSSLMLTLIWIGYTVDAYLYTH